MITEHGLPIVKPTPENIQKAATLLLEGAIVGMPTETVYGAAANAYDEEAIRKLFHVKGRPIENPLIVHISDFVQLEEIVSEWTPAADILANRFWPGPLTLVVKKSDLIPSVVTGGLDTVAVRMPDHPVALELIEAAGVPLVGPSANRFMQLSPTRAEHVDPKLSLAMILDGGPCRVGLESTVVDVTQDPPRILRPGGVSRGEIQAALGKPLGQLPPNGPRRAPGMYARHYAPIAPVLLVESVGGGEAGLVFGDPANERQIRMPNDPVAYGATLYDALNRLDLMEVEQIYVQRPPDEDIWEAVHDRLRKASSEE